MGRRVLTGVSVLWVIPKGCLVLLPDFSFEYYANNGRKKGVYVFGGKWTLARDLVRNAYIPFFKIVYYNFDEKLFHIFPDVSPKLPRRRFDFADDYTKKILKEDLKEKKKDERKSLQKLPKGIKYNFQKFSGISDQHKVHENYSPYTYKAILDRAFSCVQKVEFAVHPFHEKSQIPGKDMAILGTDLLPPDMKWRLNSNCREISQKRNIVTAINNFRYRDPKENMRKCGVPNFESSMENSPCCHVFVEEICDELWEEKESNSMKKFNEIFPEEIKKEVSNEVAVSCMKNAMTDYEIRIELLGKLLARVQAKKSE